VASRLNPYLNFSDNTREAMEFYKDVFGGNLTLNTFGDYGTQGDEANKIMHAQLETDSGFTLMAADTPEGMARNPGDNITVSLSGDDAEALRGYWEKLSDGGNVTMPMEKQMWGDEFGMCTDRFGIPWMVDIVPADAGGSAAS
jgi:PhnB protein